MSKHLLAKHSLTILDRKWKIYYVTEKGYRGPGPQGSKAVTNTETRCIYFNCEALLRNDQVAVHELVHAYSFELLGHDHAFENSREGEEFFCNLFERRGSQILEQAKPITKRLMQLKKKLAKSEASKENEE